MLLLRSPVMLNSSPYGNGRKEILPSEKGGLVSSFAPRSVAERYSTPGLHAPFVSRESHLSIPGPTGSRTSSSQEKVGRARDLTLMLSWFEDLEWTPSDQFACARSA
jgi:hypothetical protein